MLGSAEFKEAQMSLISSENSIQQPKKDPYERYVSKGKNTVPDLKPLAEDASPEAVTGNPPIY
jgi:hypothetical protein